MTSELGQNSEHSHSGSKVKVWTSILKNEKDTYKVTCTDKQNKKDENGKEIMLAWVHWRKGCLNKTLKFTWILIPCTTLKFDYTSKNGMQIRSE